MPISQFQISGGVDTYTTKRLQGLNLVGEQWHDPRLELGVKPSVLLRNQHTQQEVGLYVLELLVLGADMGKLSCITQVISLHPLP